MTTNTRSDPAARPEETAMALAKAAVQTTARALFTAQIASDALERAAACGVQPDGGMRALAAEMAALRDRLLDAFGAVPEPARKTISASRATLTSDELIDLLALGVKG